MVAHGILDYRIFRHSYLKALKMSLAEIKSLQYVLIVKAGLAVTEGPEKSIERLQSDVFIEYNLAVTNVKLPSNLKHIDKSCLIRTKNQLAPKNKVSASA